MVLQFAICYFSNSSLCSDKFGSFSQKHVLGLACSGTAWSSWVYSRVVWVPGDGVLQLKRFLMSVLNPPFFSNLRNGSKQHRFYFSEREVRGGSVIVVSAWFGVAFWWFDFQKGCSAITNTYTALSKRYARGLPPLSFFRCCCCCESTNSITDKQISKMC